MDLKNKEYIIVEIIPTKVKGGLLAQISALKINGIKLIDRFDYRLDKNLIDNIDIRNIISYDEDKFEYVLSNDSMIESFKKFIQDDSLLIINNEYTNNYLNELDNEKIDVFKLLNIEVNNDSFNKLIEKYNLEPSNYLVDLLYEALIKEV